MTDVPLLEVVGRYLDGWNSHDGEAVLATFMPQGSYRDPNVPQGVAGSFLVAYVNALSTAFPDLRFDANTVAQNGNLAVMQWIMRGTNSGPMMGRPSTGRSIALPGIDLIRVERAAITSVEGFFDRRTLLEQLGLQIAINPAPFGPVTFGTSSHVEPELSGRPGALSLTMIEVRGDQEMMRVRLGASGMAPRLPEMPGFLGFVGAAVGQRLYTISAWEQPDQARSIRNDASHAGMVREVLGGDLGIAIHTSTWIPHEFGRFLARCPDCGRFLDVTQSRQCSCGQEVRDVPTFW